MIDVLLQAGIVIIAATVLAYFGRLLKQPSIIAYIIAGIAIGPIGFGLIKNQEIISTFSEFGIVFLLFIVGLHLDVTKLKDVGKTSLLIGLGQITCVAVLGYVIASQWFGRLPALYIAAALAFSSTVIVVKLLTDKSEINTLHGRIAIGVLLFQDVVAMLALVLFSSMGTFSSEVVLSLIIKLLIFFVGVGLVGFLIMPYLLRFAAKSQELLFLVSLGWAFLISLTAMSFDFSIAMGAFVAGVTLAHTPFTTEVSSRIRPLRDFFVTMFFVSLGMQIAIGPLTTYIVPIVLLSLAVLVINPFVVLFVTALLGYHPRTSFLTAVSFTQISEFSLVLVALGLSLGHISAEIVAIVAAIATLTILVSSYTITYNEQLYNIVKPLLRWKSSAKAESSHAVNHDVVLCGYKRIGYAILKRLHQLGKRVMIVDYDPDTIKSLSQQKIPCLYGDVSDADVVEEMKLDKIKMLVSTISNMDDNLLLIRTLKRVNAKAFAVVTAEQIDDALRLYAAGADYVIVPHLVGGDHFALLLEGFDFKALVKHKKNHIYELHQRKMMGH